MLFSYILISILQNQLFFKKSLLTFSTTLFHVKQYKKISCVILIKVFHISPDLSTSVENCKFYVSRETQQILKFLLYSFFCADFLE